MTLHASNLDLRTGQVEVRGNAGEIRKARLLDQILHRGLTDHCGVKTASCSSLETQGAGGIPLRIEIKQEDGVP